MVRSGGSQTAFGLLQGEEQSQHMWVPQMSLLHSQYLTLNNGDAPSIEYLQLPLIPVEDAHAQPRPSTPDRPCHTLQNKFHRLFESLGYFISHAQGVIVPLCHQQAEVCHRRSQRATITPTAVGRTSRALRCSST